VKDSVQATLRESHITSGVERYEVADWGRDFGIAAGVTAAGSGRDYGLGSPEPAPDTLQRWNSLATELGGHWRGTVVSRQVHGRQVAVHRDRGSGLRILQACDGHVTQSQDLLLAVTVADCVPVYLLEPRSRTMGLLHAGWRGIAAGVFEAGVHAVCEVAGATPPDLVMHCGIGICGACYEVGPEVVAAVAGVRPSGGPQGLDLREILQVRAVQLQLAQVTASPWCTAHDAGRFASHRGSGGVDGRMAAYLGAAAP
jgi:YfiH family protein